MISQSLKVDSQIKKYKKVDGVSGTYGFFKKEALFKGDYKNEVKEQPASVVQGITEDCYDLGYSGVGCKTNNNYILKIVFWKEIKK